MKKYLTVNWPNVLTVSVGVILAMPVLAVFKWAMGLLLAHI